MSRKYLKTIVFISMGVFSLFSWGLLTRTQTTADPTPKENRTRTTQRQTVYRPSQNSQDTLKDFQQSEFYRTIIDKSPFVRSVGHRHALETPITYSAHARPQMGKARHGRSSKAQLPEEPTPSPSARRLTPTPPLLTSNRNR